MNRNTFLSILLAAIIGGALAIGGYKTFERETPAYKSIQDRQETIIQQVSANYAETVPLNLDFTQVAQKGIHSVVYIQSVMNSAYSSQSYRFRQGPAISSGSGVIISDDGYIVTNNHVVENAEEISVTLEDNQNFTAKVIGTDPTTDLALIKIEAQNLEFLPYGDSDEVTIGQWVLAVGNPLDLTSTVTAGIVSAKARNIGILRGASMNRSEIESFIQTDAAVNPGNSGGALMNTQGELVGINTAIASRTGSYAGYSFAVPVNLVKKVMDDLLEFGAVQRGLLGITIRDVNAQLAKERNLDVTQGVYVAEVTNGSGAEEAGIEPEDVIVAVDGKEVKNTSRLQELVAIHRPGEKVDVVLLRDGKQKTVKATLKNTSGTLAIVERIPEEIVDGTVFEEVSEAEGELLGIDGGVKITELGAGKWQDAGFEEGFIITHIDKQEVTSVPELKSIIAGKNNERVVFLGIFPDGTKSYFSVDW